jgi:hypothetical protein
MEKCSKCGTKCGPLARYTDLKEKWALCYFCYNIFDNRAHLLNEFLKEDCGAFPVSRVEKDMINARIRRAKGELKWAAK